MKKIILGTIAFMLLNTLAFANDVGSADSIFKKSRQTKQDFYKSNGRHRILRSEKLALSLYYSKLALELDSIESSNVKGDVDSLVCNEVIGSTKMLSAYYSKWERIHEVESPFRYKLEEIDSEVDSLCISTKNKTYKLNKPFYRSKMSVINDASDLLRDMADLID